MKKELENYLCKKYPKLYTDCGQQELFTLFGFECSDGWFRLILWLSTYIQDYLDQNNRMAEKYPDKYKPIKQVKVLQVKEKFGTLRYYYSGGDDKISEVVQFAEYLSSNICETTGKTDNVGRNTTGWIKTHHKDLSKPKDFIPVDDEELIKILDI